MNAGTLNNETGDDLTFTASKGDQTLSTTASTTAEDFLIKAAAYQYEDTKTFGTYTVNGDEVTVYVSKKGPDSGNNDGRDTMVDATARFLGALYRFDDGKTVSAITYDGDEYTWEGNLDGSNWKVDSLTLTKAIFGSSSDEDRPAVCPDNVTITVNNVDVTLNLVFAEGITAETEWDSQSAKD